MRKRRTQRSDYTHQNTKDGHPKTVSKRYIVTTQTAYHVTKIALQEGITEGRVIDKMMRSYLAEHGSY